MITELEKKNITVLYGGLSAEREISLKTGKAIISALHDAGYRVTGIDVDRQIVERLHRDRPDVVFIALHGRWGEDGTIQGVLEYLGIPYTGSGVTGSAVALDKLRSKQLFMANGLPTPPFQLLREDDALPVITSWPVIVKPAREGSSIGMSLVREADGLAVALAAAFACDREVLVEEYICGREFTVGVMGNNPLEPLPIVEIMPTNDFFDFTAKYTKGKTEYRVPAQITPAIASEMSRLAVAACRALECYGLARVDVMLDKKEKPYLLEINTIPGMTSLSLLPMAAAAAGLSFVQLLEKALLCALSIKGKETNV